MAEGVLFPATVMPDDDWWHELWPDPMGTLAKIGIVPGMTVVDLCCGNGHFTAPLVCLAGPKGNVIAVDLDAQMLDMARLRVEQATQGRPVAPCQWVVADACKLDQVIGANIKADALVIANTFHGVPDQAALSAVVARVLKPGGSFTIINWHTLARTETVVLGQARGPKDEMRMSPASVEAVVSTAGFIFSQTIELPPYHYAAVFQVA
jgi:ubiquinone/menaquinone biosynthesis C-methylase UbiE